MNLSRTAILTFLFLAAGAVTGPTADAASVIPQSKISPQNAGKPASGTVLQPAAAITFTTGMTPQQLLGMFLSGYGFGSWNGDTIPVSWGVRHYRVDGFLWNPSMDICDSDYSISVTLTGPAGVSPF